MGLTSIVVALIILLFFPKSGHLGPTGYYVIKGGCVFFSLIAIGETFYKGLEEGIRLLASTYIVVIIFSIIALKTF